MRLIDWDKVLEWMHRQKETTEQWSMRIAIENYIDEMPTVDAELVRHGQWEQVEVVHDRKDAKIQDWQQAKCSVCGRWQTTPFMYYLKLDNYCPHCGAKMDEEEER